MPKLKEFTLIIFIIIAVIILIYGLVFFGNKITGKISFELEAAYEEGKPLEGTLKLSLKEGELIPASSKIIFENAGKIYEYELNEIVSDELVSGDFYVEGQSLSGTGQGFGFKGEKTTYPIVYFTLEIFTESGSSEEFQEIKAQIPIEEVEEEKNLLEQAPEVSVEATEKTQDEEIAPITGNIISGFFGGVFNFFLRLTGQVSLELEEQIEGEVSANQKQILKLGKGQTAEISSGSVRTDSIKLSDDEIDLNIQGNQVIVTTTYSETEKGFGKDYLGKKAKTLSIDLSGLDFITEPGELKVNLVYENKEIVSLTTSLAEGKITAESETQVSEPEEETEQVDLTNVTPVNLTKTNVTISKTISGLSEEERETLINEFGNISVEITKAEKTEEDFMVRFELKNFWVENHYSSEISDEKLKEQVEKDRVNFLRDLARKFSEQETPKQEIEGLIGSYEI